MELDDWIAEERQQEKAILAPLAEHTDGLREGPGMGKWDTETLETVGRIDREARVISIVLTNKTRRSYKQQLQRLSLLFFSVLKDSDAKKIFI